MGFDHNPYRHMELIAAERTGDVERRLANVLAGRTPDSKSSLTTEQLQAASRVLAAGYTPPRRAPDVPETWVWYCHNCGGRGTESGESLPKLVADWVAHLIASHNASPQDFEGWSEV